MPNEESLANGNSRLRIVSNRLPLTIKRSDDGQYKFSMSSGGLVTGLSGLSKTMQYEWYGWPGLEVPENEIPHVQDMLKKDCNAHPVFIDDDLADKHYNGFSSTCPTSHSRPPQHQRHPADSPVPQTRSSGPCSTTTPVRSPSTSLHGLPTTKSTSYLPRRSLPTSRTMT